MVALRSHSAFRCLTFPSDLSSPLESFFAEWPFRSTRRSLIGASSLPSSSKTVKSQILSVPTLYDGE